MIQVFLHGLESSSRGTKGRWFRERFPDMLIPDFSGSLDERMLKFNGIIDGRDDLILVGSSFGGLMATVYAIEHPEDVSRIVLLVPALNFPEFAKYRSVSINVPAILYGGRNDTLCPPDVIIPAAKKVFVNLTVFQLEDDHLLHHTFSRIDWLSLLQ